MGRGQGLTVTGCGVRPRRMAPRSTAALATLMLMLMLAGCGRDAPASAPDRAAAFRLGVNVTTVSYYSGEPTLANLLTGGRWVTDETAVIDPVNGITLSPGHGARLYLTTPVPVLTGRPTRAVCSWRGRADVGVGGLAAVTARTANSIAFDWTPWTEANRGQLVWLDVHATDRAGAHDFDCRLAGLPRDAALSPEVVASLKPFQVLRFLDWSNANGNPAHVTWAGRTRPDALYQADGPTGVALEHMIALARATGAAPWFTVPWNADEDYQRRMARMVHDRLPPDRDVYVELSNEVWNAMFGAMRQAEQEGLAEGLSTNGFRAAQLRYAEKVRWMMPIWAKVFADRPGRLIRVGATMAAMPDMAAMQLDEGRMAEAIDAIAIAPYFGGTLMNVATDTFDPASLLTGLAADADRVMEGEVAAYRTLADQHGKRLIAYEAGQHMTGAGKREEALRAVNRAPAMYDIYRDYIGSWRATVGDTMVLYNSTSPISQYGAWGLQEYVGQPLGQAPKRRAALLYSGKREIEAK